MQNIIPLIAAHTGNDAVNHAPTIFDWIIGLLMIIVLALLITWRIKRRRKRGKG